VPLERDGLSFDPEFAESSSNQPSSHLTAEVPSSGHAAFGRAGRRYLQNACRTAQ
jgi:hypothetical protein